MKEVTVLTNNMQVQSSCHPHLTQLSDPAPPSHPLANTFKQVSPDHPQLAISTNEEKRTHNEENFDEKTQRKLATKAVLTFQRKIQPDKSNKIRTDNHNPSFIAAETDDNLVTKTQSHSLIARKPFLETNNNNYQSKENVEHVEPSIHPDLLEKKKTL